MKKLIKYYDSTDPKLVNYQFGDNYGSFNSIIKSIVCGTGINPVAISIIEVLENKKVKFYFTTSGNYNYKLDEVVNLQDNNKQEYVIKEINTAYVLCEYYDDHIISSNPSYNGKLVNSSLGFDLFEDDNAGRIVIATETKVAKYIFRDMENLTLSPIPFKNTDAVKAVGCYLEAYNNPGILAPLPNGDNYNNIDWNAINNTNIDNQDDKSELDDMLFSIQSKLRNNVREIIDCYEE